MKQKILLPLFLLFMLPLSLATSVDRGISNLNPSPGDTITITLTTVTSTGDKSILIEETAPFDIVGGTSNVYQVAMLDQIQVDDFTKTYSIIVPIAAGGIYGFTGRYTINGGADQTITGQNQITIGGPCTDGDQILCPLQQGVCSGAQQICIGGVWPGCTATEYGIDYESGEITCDGLDNDCDGTTDEGDLCPGQTCEGVDGCQDIPVTCGNNQIDTGEDCDGTLLGGKTCVTEGFDSGTLACKDCAFDTSGCTTDEEECEFWEKWDKTDQECKTDTGKIILYGVLIFIALMFFRMMSG